MIRDPSDGSVRLRQEASPDAVRENKLPENPPIKEKNEMASGLRESTQKADYLARLEESRKWLESYVRPTITQRDNE